MNRVNILTIKSMKSMRRIYREMKSTRKHFKKWEEHNQHIKSILLTKLWRKLWGLMRLSTISNRLWCLLLKIGRLWNIILFNKIHSHKFLSRIRKNEKVHEYIKLLWKVVFCKKINGLQALRQCIEVYNNNLIIFIYKI